VSNASQVAPALPRPYAALIAATTAAAVAAVAAASAAGFGKDDHEGYHRLARHGYLHGVAAAASSSSSSVLLLLESKEKDEKVQVRQR
jgi:hypothetical protein